MDNSKKLVLEEKALKDAEELLQILKNTPVIEQPEKSLEFVKNLSYRLRAEKWIEIERIKTALEKATNSINQ